MAQPTQAQQLQALTRASKLMSAEHLRLATEHRTSPHADIRRACGAEAKKVAKEMQTLQDIAELISSDVYSVGA